DYYCQSADSGSNIF
nr:immunoglobulin light chain junction region [Macaca mulatta]MOW03555.1 immunoglobulin light chain junction region [Macaca mulatta]